MSDPGSCLLSPEVNQGRRQLRPDHAPAAVFRPCFDHLASFSEENLLLLRTHMLQGVRSATKVAVHHLVDRIAEVAMEPTSFLDRLGFETALLATFQTCLKGLFHV